MSWLMLAGSGREVKDEEHRVFVEKNMKNARFVVEN